KTFELKGSTLVQKDHEVNVDIVGFALPERNSSEELVPDGQEHTVQMPAFFPGMPPTLTHVTVVWQGDNLVLQESGQSFIGPVTIPACRRLPIELRQRRYRASTAAPEDELSLSDAVVGQGVRIFECCSLAKRAMMASTEKSPAPKIRTMSEAKRKV